MQAPGRAVAGFGRCGGSAVRAVRLFACGTKVDCSRPAEGIRLHAPRIGCWQDIRGARLNDVCAPLAPSQGCVD